ncbi:DUF4157 domain-containing protein [Streptomyces sp. NBC_00554]|uniref:eCIS core domain-containing protein n=1 Tax=Streptomyces sp. NBC_00554 TaxID=2903661 RepID=UPI00352EF642|nr:DUF4157 domain-containing protein [Streptomyces sp. NBC_00554]
MSNSQSQDAQTDQAAEQRRRKRKERAAKSRTPEPKDIVSGAGQPLDIGVRRELEEQLGHDLSRVRLHTDRDAGVLTDLLGADAVAVGQDIFFRAGAYRPGTVDGQRLLAHELLHTVQNPDGLGALRAGRDLGAVSLPQQAIEREAESAAQDLVRPSVGEPAEASVEVSEGQATPGWMRYATVDADRNRIEQIDPATLVDRLTNSVVRSLRGDPEDRSKRTRMQLARLPEELLDGVLEHLESRLLSSEHERVLDLVDEIEQVGADGLEQNSLDVPVVERDPAEELRFEREAERQSAEEKRDEEERDEERKPAGKPGSETDTAGAEGADSGRGGGSSESTGRQSSAPAAPAAAPQQQASGRSASSGGKSDGGQQGGEKKAAGSEGAKEGQDQQGAPAATKEESAAKNRPGAVDALVAGRQLKQEDKLGADKPTGSSTASGKDTQLPGSVSTLDGVRNQDLDGLEEETGEDLSGSGGESEVEVGGAEKSAWDTKLQPEDFLPVEDLDVSAVPTADEADPGSAAAAVPSFPAPPATKADKVQAERDAEDAEDAAAESESEEEVADAAGDTETAAAADEGGPEGGPSGGLDPEPTAAALPVPGTVSKDPKSGDDPKAGPVAAQTTVQEAPGKAAVGGDTQETAAKEASAKEEKGTPAAGDKSGGAQEKASPQATGGKAATSEPAGGKSSGAASASAGKSEPAAESQAPSAARDSHVSGGSPAGTSGGESTPQAEAPAAKAPAAPEPVAAPEAQTTPAPAAEEAPAPRAPGREQASARQASQASQASRGGSGGGGGGSKAAAPGKGKKDSAAATNLSQVSPEAGLSTAAKLKPHKALQAMSGVSGAADRTVGDEHKALAAAPPQMQRPAGAPQTLEGKPRSDAPAQYSQDPAQKSEAPKDEKAEVEGAKEPEGQIEAEQAEEPGGWDTFKMALGFGLGWIANKLGFEVDAQELAAKFAGLPTKDEALKKAQAGNAPGVQMQDTAEQAAGEQGESVDAKGRQTVTTARDDAGRPMGENQVYPNAPKEQMKGKVPGQQGGKGGVPEGGASTGAVPPEAASAVAEHDRGPQFQAAFSQGQKGMSEGRQTKDRDFRDSQQKHKQQVDGEIAKNTKSQAGERDKALSEVTGQRTDWRTEQDEELKKLGTKKTERHDKVRKDVQDKEEKTDKDVTKEKGDGDKKIQDANTKAEQDAEKERDNSVQESGNWISKAFDWIKQKVIEIKNAIVRVIRAARDAVVGFIKNFRETVERWINEARRFIVDTVKKLIDDLIEFAKAMVRAVIELANRIRKFITSLIAAAIALVNRLATQLRQIVADLLNAIAKMLSDILNVLRKMLQDVIKAVMDAIKTVLDYASKLLSALGDFMLIAVDFLSDPGGWLSGAKNSAVDGAKNHLFREVQAAVKQWFQSKIEEIIGIPRAILDRLIKGGITLEKIVKETWDAIVPQLPFIIGEIVITKVIAKLIPGAGWAMAVIDAIRTAIGALGEILRAIGAVIGWLKAVRQGGAGILFAKAVAAGIVALLELAYEALISGIGKYVAKVGKRLKGVAAKLGNGDKGREKGPAGQGSDDRGGNNKGDTNGRSAPTDTAARPTAATPAAQPANRPDAKPGTAPSPKQPAPKQPATKGDEKPTENKGGGKRPTGSEKDGRPKGDKEPEGTPTHTNKPDTRPTPAPKSKPEPAPASKPQPREDTGPAASPKPDKDAPGRSKPDKDDDKPAQPKDDKDSTKPKDGTPGKPGQDMDAPGKPKPKPDKDSPGRPRTKPDKGGPGKPRPRPDRSGPGRPKRQPDKERQKKEEESKAERLAKIIARIRPLIRKQLAKGMDPAVHRQMLASMRRHYRLTSLSKAGQPDFTITARLNPQGTVTGGYTKAEDLDTNGYEEHTDYLTDQPDPKLPAPRIPKFVNGQLAKNFKAEHLNKEFVEAHGQKANSSLIQEPIGFRHINKYDLNTDASKRWVRMHLLTEKLGGPFLGTNLVPAQNSINNPTFKWGIEQYPEKEVRRKDDSRDDKLRMVWYQIGLTWHTGPVKGFPHSISAAWGTYRYDRDAKAWKEKVPTDRGPLNFSVGPLDQPPQPQGAPRRVLINRDSNRRMMRMLNVSPAFAEAIRYARTNRGDGTPATKPPGNTTELAQRLNELPEKRRNRIRDFTAGIVSLAVAEQENLLEY